MNAQAAPANAMEKAANTSSALPKLALFAFLLGAAPLSTYYLTLDRLWEGNSQYAAISAVFVANVVLVGYVLVAIFEDSTPPAAITQAKETRKEK